MAGIWTDKKMSAVGYNLNPVRVLEVNVSVSGIYGGVAKFWYEFLSRMDLNRIRPDFLFGNVRTIEGSAMEGIYENSGLYALHTWNSKAGKLFRTAPALREVLKEGRWDAIHVHTGDVLFESIFMHEARKSGIDVRIAHSHSVYVKNNKKLAKTLISPIGQQIVRRDSTHQLACSYAAAKGLFGDISNLGNFHLVRNAIDLGRYRYDESVRESVRREFDVGEKQRILIIVGNLVKVKNHAFLMEAFQRASARNDDLRLWIVGSGMLESELKNQASELGIEDKVAFFGQRNDVNKLLQAADMYVCTSLSEGLSISVVEAQASGIPVLASGNISDEHRLTDLVQFKELSDGSDRWGEKIVEMMENYTGHRDTYEEMVAAGYDINEAAKWLESFYISAARGGDSQSAKLKKIRVLQVCVCPAGSYGGVQHFLYDYCSRMDPDVIETEFMYINKRPRNAAGFGELLDRSKVYELKVFDIKSTVMKYRQMRKKAKEVLENNAYDVIHINSGHIYIALLMSRLAKEAGISVRIVHSHSYYVNEKVSTKIIGTFLNDFARKQVISASTHQFTCSDRAGKSMYGRIDDLLGYRVIKNAIDVGKFRYDPKVRDEVRKEMGAEDKRVVITVGNLMPVKNHKFLIDVFGEIKKMGDGAVLWIVGGGELKEELEAQIRSMGLQESVKLTGARNDIYRILQGADLYVCPSHSEGLPISSIEAQASGLRLLESTGVPEDVNVTGRCEFMPLSDGTRSWAERIIQMLDQAYGTAA